MWDVPLLLTLGHAALSAHEDRVGAGALKATSLPLTDIVTLSTDWFLSRTFDPRLAGGAIRAVSASQRWRRRLRPCGAGRDQP